MKMRKHNTRAAKLKPADVFDIRAAYSGGATQRELAQTYHLSVVQVGRVVRGESWAQYTNPTVEDEQELRTIPATPELDRLAAESLRQLQNKLASEQVISDRKEDLEEEIPSERQEQLLRRLSADAGENPAVDLEHFKESDK